MKTKRINLTWMVVLIFACESEDPFLPIAEDPIFLGYTVSEQTSLATYINYRAKKIALEVAHDVDLSSLVAEFEVDGDYKVLVNGVEQTSGVSTVDLTETVSYNLVNAAENTSTEWQVSATELKCKIIIDATHDGGEWWYPQGDGIYSPLQPHSGRDFAFMLRNKGFEVTELGRAMGGELTEEMFFGGYIVLRIGGLQTYSQKEVEIYSNLLDRGMNLAFFADGEHFDFGENANDEIADIIGLKFQGVAYGIIKDFAPHEITAGLDALAYVDGSAILEPDLNSDIEVLGRLGPDDFVDLNANNVKEPNEPTGSAIMGLLKYRDSRIFFIGDTNSIQTQPQPFIDNLVAWMGDCSAM